MSCGGGLILKKFSVHEITMEYKILSLFLQLHGVMCSGLRRVGAKQHERGVCEAPAGVVLFEGKALHITSV